MNNRRQRGFTLIETLISLIILAGALSAALAMIRTAESLNAAAQRRQQFVDNAYGESYLRALLVGAAPVIVKSASGAPVVDFRGTPDEITFYSTYFVAAEAPVLRKRRLTVKDGAIFISASIDGPEEGLEARKLVDLDGPAEFRFGAGGTEGLQFRDSWIGENRLPAVIVVTRTTDTGAIMPPVVAAAPILSAAF